MFARRLLRRALLAGFYLTSASAAIALPQGITQGATVEGITEYRLQNGLRVLLFPDPTQAKTTVNITFLVGSRMENYGETGMAHLLEHMTFKGTPTQGNIMAALGERGMDFNGTTWLDRTNYFETFPSSDENLAWVLSMEADRMVHSNIARKDLDSEMTVVRNEMERGENEPERILIQRAMSMAYDWHNYGHDTIGARSDVELVDIGRLQAFYRMYYQPDNAVLLIAGAFDPDKALALIAKSFGPIPKPARSSSAPRAPPTPRRRCAARRTRCVSRRPTSRTRRSAAAFAATTRTARRRRSASSTKRHPRPTARPRSSGCACR